MSEPGFCLHYMRWSNIFPSSIMETNMEVKLNMSDLWRSPCRCGRALAPKCVINATLISCFPLIIEESRGQWGKRVPPTQQGETWQSLTWIYVLIATSWHIDSHLPPVPVSSALASQIKLFFPGCFWFVCFPAENLGPGQGCVCAYVCVGAHVCVCVH